MSTLRVGSKGPEVKRLQELLGVQPADGDFGPKTLAAVKQYQQSKGLVADGVVGNKTWETLEKGTSPSRPGGGGGDNTPSAGSDTNNAGSAPDTPSGADGPAPNAASSITLAQLQKIFTQCKKSKLEAYLPLLNSAMTEALINTKLRKCAWLAQLAVESLEFIYMKEQGGYAYFMKMYDVSSPLANRRAKARELGNLAVGDGAKYPGRGPIQVTGKTNYTDCGKALGLDLVNHPELLEQPALGFRGSAWFWKTKGCNQLADIPDFEKVVRRVNGGLNHYDRRLAYYNTAKQVL